MDRDAEDHKIFRLVAVLADSNQATTEHKLRVYLYHPVRPVILKLHWEVQAELQAVLQSQAQGTSTIRPADRKLVGSK